MKWAGSIPGEGTSFAWAVVVVARRHRVMFLQRRKGGVKPPHSWRPRDPAHGDAASNVALVMARGEKKPPRAIAEIIRANLELPPEVAEASVAGAGFINFRMAPAYWHGELRRAAAEGERFWRPQIGAARKVQVEFLSANPTGPLTVGHGRNAVLGDTLARMHEASGFVVTREYYFNNGGRQMKLLGESVRARYLEEIGRPATMPEDGYQGEYIRDVARDLVARHGETLADAADARSLLAPPAEEAIFADIRRTCERLGIRFDVFTNELDLIRGGQVDAVIEGLRERGLIAEYDGAVWLRGEPLGLPKDRVLVRSGPATRADLPHARHRLSYREAAARLRQRDRRFRRRPYRRASGRAGGGQGAGPRRHADSRDHLPVRDAHARWREGQDVDAQGDLRDAGRTGRRGRRRRGAVFFPVSQARQPSRLRPRSGQASGAREPGLLRAVRARAPGQRVSRGGEEGDRIARGLPRFRVAVDLAPLSEEEIGLARKLVDLPDVIRGAVESLEPHRVPFYLLELAGDFHRYYNKPSNRIISEQRELSLARLFLARLLMDGIKSGLDLLGVSAPDRM